MSIFNKAREAVLAAEEHIETMRSEIVRKQALVDMLKADRAASEPSESQPTVVTSESSQRDAMVKGIYSIVDLQSFLASSACQEILHFLQDLNACARHLHNASKAREEDGSAEASTTEQLEIHNPQRIDTLLKRAMGLIDETPPEELDPQRFGNKAFRKWHAKLVNFLEEENVDEEFSAYMTRSFGDAHRLDYGTGHEATFLMLMLVIYKREKNTLVLAYFLRQTLPMYLKVVRRLRAVYRLEPAGSHGVWSLDDYHFLPFILGSSQLSQGPTRPRDLLSSPSLAELTPDSDYFSDALLDILRSKRGPFREHSPLLHALRNCMTWDDVNTGLLAMWKGEVIGKFPVAQHFLFGPSLPLTWTIAPLPSNPVAPLEQQQQQHNADPLAKYFHMTMHSSHPQGSSSSSAATAIPSSPQQSVSEFLLREDGNGLTISNWQMSAMADSKISGEADLQALEAKFPSELDFPLPEMLFSKNFLRLEHNNICIEFTAEEALRGCKMPANNTSGWDRKMIKVPMADKWASRRDHEGNPIKTWREDYDWTFTTRRLCTITTKSSESTEQLPAKMVRTPRRIDYERLKQREPILWSKEVLLFEDDLFDLGISKLSVKIRVMPSSWFILARLFVRVDGVFLRCFDCRVYHLFGTKHVLVEESERESEMQALLGGTVDTKDLVDPNYVASILPLVKDPVTHEVNLG